LEPAAATPPPLPPLPPLAPSFTPEPPPAEPVPELPMVEGEYTRTLTYRLRADILRWVAPVCLAIIFLLSFGNWIGSLNLWESAFGGHPVLNLPGFDMAIPAGHSSHSAGFIVYVIFTLFFALPLAWVKLAFEKNWIPNLDALHPIWPWRAVIVGGVAALGALLLLFLWISSNLSQWNFMALAMKVAVRLHLIAVVAYAAEYWLELRKQRRLPLPDVTVRW
jgi:hypothetical protein